MRNWSPERIIFALVLWLVSCQPALSQTISQADRPASVIHSGDVADFSVKKWRGVAACGDIVFELTAKFPGISESFVGEWDGSYYNPKRIPGYRYRNGPFVGSSPPFGNLPMRYNASLGLLEVETRRGNWIASVIGSSNRMAFVPQGRLAEYCSDLVLYADRKARNQTKKIAEGVARLRVERRSGNTASDYLKIETQAVHVRTISALMNPNPLNRRAIDHLNGRLDPRLQNTVSKWDDELAQAARASRRTVRVPRPSSVHHSRRRGTVPTSGRAAKSPSEVDVQMQSLMGCDGLLPIVRDSFERNPQLAFLQMPPKAYETLGACAGANNAEANYYLGANSAFGFLTDRDLGQARFQLTKSLELGYEKAGFLLLFLIGEHEELQRPRYAIKTVELLEGLRKAPPELVAQKNRVVALQNEGADLREEMSKLRREIRRSEAQLDAACQSNPAHRACQNR